jgi:hypothetical protein
MDTYDPAPRWTARLHKICALARAGFFGKLCGLFAILRHWRPTLSERRSSSRAPAYGAIGSTTEGILPTAFEPAGSAKDALAMRVTLSRWSIVGTLLVGLPLLAASGCQSGAGWGWSSPSWMSWNNLGWGKTATPTALASTKPGTSVPKPSTTATPQATSSVAAGTGQPTGYPTATNPNYAAAGYTAGNYPATSRGYTSPYSTQPASAYQQAGSTAQVQQPSVGYQTGPYGMTSSGGAGAPSAYAAGGYGQSGYPSAAGTSWNTPAAASPSAYPSSSASGAYGAYPSSGSSAYQTADQRSMYGSRETSPYSNDPSRGSYGASAAAGSSAASPATYGSSPTAAPSSYGPSGGTYGSSSGTGYGASPAPSAATGPWNGYSQPSAPYNQGTSTQPAGTAGPAATAYDPTATSATAVAGSGGLTPPAAAPAVPSSLATDTNSYRPGSTAGNYGVQSATYNQPQPTPSSTYSPGGAVNYGNTYTR